MRSLAYNADENTQTYKHTHTHTEADEVCHCQSRWCIGPFGFGGAITLLSINPAIGGIIRQVRARPPPLPLHSHTHKYKHPSPLLWLAPFT